MITLKVMLLEFACGTRSLVACSVQSDARRISDGSDGARFCRRLVIPSSVVVQAIERAHKCYIVPVGGEKGWSCGREPLRKTYCGADGQESPSKSGLISLLWGAETPAIAAFPGPMRSERIELT